MNWQAKWIWAKSRSEAENFYMYARREIDLPDASDCVLHITCSSEYKLYVNGRYLGRGPGPCDPAYQSVDCYDLKRRSGRVVIGVICYNHGVTTISRVKAPGGLLVQLQGANGHVILASDETWKVKPAADWDSFSQRLSPTLGFQEIYDSRKKPVGWNVIGFDDSDWEEPEVIGDVGADPWVRLMERRIHRLEESELFPVSVVESVGVGYPENAMDAVGSVATAAPNSEAFMVLNFGREVVGYPRIRVRDGGHAIIEIDCGAAVPDRATLHGGRREWQAFCRRAFRYMRVTFRELAGPLHIESVSVDCVRYPARPVWKFECSDDTLTRIYRQGVDTLALCMQDTYESDPLVLPAARPGHARVQALVNYHSFGDTELAAKTIRELVHCQEEDGFVNALHPFERRYTSPDQALQWVVMLHDYYLYTGDRLEVEDVYPRMRSLLECWVRSREGAAGLLTDSAGRYPLAWSALYYQALRDASKLAAALGENDDSLLWHSHADCILHAFNERFWCGEQRSYLTCHPDGVPSFRANTLAVAFGLAGAEKFIAIREWITSGIEQRTGRNFYLDFTTLQALARLDMIDEALRLIRSEWGEPRPDLFRRGATAAPTFFLPSEILGVKPSTPRSPTVIIRPALGDIEWARGGFGSLEIEWRFVGGKFTIDISGPDGFVVALPAYRFSSPVVHEIDLTPETPERKARKTYGWGDVIWRGDTERDPYVDWLETQESEPPEHYEVRKRCSSDERFIWISEPISTHVRYDVHEE